MTAAEEQAVIVLLAAQANVLIEIRDMMRTLIAAANEEQPDPFETCQHPEESRVDMSTLSDRNHWVCKDCRYDNKAVA